jgi:TolB protein
MKVLKRWMVGCLFLVMCGAACALELELTQGLHASLPIGVDALGSSRGADTVNSVIKHDLMLSGQFKMVSASPGSSVAVFRSLGADSVVKGQVTPGSGGLYDVNFELMDAVTGGAPLVKRSFHVRESELRAVAHYISDLVYEKLTGEKGIFSTRIAYVLVRQGRHSLEVADADGDHPQSLLISSEPIMSPSWSPDGRKIACVSFEKRRAQIYMIDVETGQRQLVTSFPGINGAPAWSPDGRSLVVVLSKEGSPKLYEIKLASGQMKQLTFGPSIDTEPRYTPDGKSIVFTSGRGGSPQIYRLNLASGDVKRLTFEGTYNAKASLTPNQSQLVMLHRGDDKRFTIAVQDMINGRLDILSGGSSAVDESPSIAPNGRLVLYATREHDRGLLEIVSMDGRIHMKLPSKEGDVQEPAWSPFLG